MTLMTENFFLDKYIAKEAIVTNNLWLGDKVGKYYSVQ